MTVLPLSRITAVWLCVAAMTAGCAKKADGPKASRANEQPQDWTETFSHTSDPGSNRLAFSGEATKTVRFYNSTGPAPRHLLTFTLQRGGPIRIKFKPQGQPVDEVVLAVSDTSTSLGHALRYVDIYFQNAADVNVQVDE